MKVWLVSSGCYSDYEIEGIFSEESLARAYCAELHSRGKYFDDADVSEWEVDSEAGKVFRTAFRACIRLVSGEIFGMESESLILASPHARSMNNAYGAEIGTNSYLEVFSFVSPEHARKLAVEHRQAWLRNSRLTAGIEG